VRIARSDPGLHVYSALVYNRENQCPGKLGGLSQYMMQWELRPRAWDSLQLMSVYSDQYKTNVIGEKKLSGWAT